jgi:hypothetical protein
MDLNGLHRAAANAISGLRERSSFQMNPWHCILTPIFFDRLSSSFFYSLGRARTLTFNFRSQFGFFISADGFEIAGQHWALVWSGPQSHQSVRLFQDWTDG